MPLYSIGALIKLLFGAAVLWLLYHYVHVYEQPVIGLSLGFLGVFLFVWGISYFFFLLCYRFFSHRDELKQSSQSYTHSLLLAIWMMVNITLMITDNWSGFAAIGVFVFFLILHAAIIHESEPAVIQ